MRVTQTGSNQVQGTEVAQTRSATKSQQAKATDKSGTSSGASSTEGARAEISAKGRELARAKDVAMSAPDTRDDKIAELKRRIAAGSYQVDAKAVADRMVDEHLSSGIG